MSGLRAYSWVSLITFMSFISTHPATQNLLENRIEGH